MLHNKLIKAGKPHIKRVITEAGDYNITAKCIKVTPLSKSCKKDINDAIAATRKIWNSCVNEVNKNGDITKYDKLRDKFVVYKNMSDKNRKALDWTFRVAQKVREAVTRKFYANYTTAKANLENSKYKSIFKKKKDKLVEKKKKITMRFIPKDAEEQVIHLSTELCTFNIENGKTILETFNGIKLLLNESYTNFNISTKCERCQHIFRSVATLNKHINLKKQCKEVEAIESGIPHADIILKRIGYEYFIYVPEYSTPIIKEMATRDIVALDAGWNTLLTYYAPDGEWGEIAPGIKDKLNSIYHVINDLKKKGKYKAIKKRKGYIRNMINDLQWKICHWLLSKFRKIVISRLYVARCNKRGKQIQADLKLCSFVDRLIHKSIEYKGSEIHICKEHYTSQACTKCLSLNTVKNNTVKCNDCNNEIHRDLNGARNIFLKHCK